MERDQKLLVKILEVCIQGSEEWSLDVSAKDIRARFCAEEIGRWSVVAVGGHIELLVDRAVSTLKGRRLIYVFSASPTPDTTISTEANG
jgi:hypothetical protein